MVGESTGRSTSQAAGSSRDVKREIGVMDGAFELAIHQVVLDSPTIKDIPTKQRRQPFVIPVWLSDQQLQAVAPNPDIIVVEQENSGLSKVGRTSTYSPGTLPVSKLVKGNTRSSARFLGAGTFYLPRCPKGTALWY